MDPESTSEGEFAPVKETIGPDRRDFRLQDALVGLFPILLPSRKACKKAIQRGQVLLNDAVASTAGRVKPGDTVSFCPKPAPKTSPLGPNAPQNIRVIRPPEGEYALVWKPAGLATSGTGQLNLTRVLSQLAHHGTHEQRLQLTPHIKDALPAPQPVHRLDRATAGWVCVALNLKAARSLGQAFEQRTVAKRYLALVSGGLTQSGSNTHPLDEKVAITHWTPLCSGPLPVHGTATLIVVHIETGRTHQIRRHLADIGHALVGEDRYAPGQDTPKQAQPLRYTGHGLFLSAVHLSIPSGDHGPAANVEANPPKKFTQIRWVLDHLNSRGPFTTP